MKKNAAAILRGAWWLYTIGKVRLMKSHLKKMEQDARILNDKKD